MNPSEVRRRVLDDHRRLKALLKRVDRLILERRAKPEVDPQLAVTIRTLVQFLRQHMDLEDNLLTPALEDADAWGDVRVGILDQHHVDQRALCDEIDAVFADDPVDMDALVKTMGALSVEILADMADEEKRLVHKDILRDDIVAIGGFGG